MTEQPTMTCQTVTALLDAFAFGALDTDEAVPVRCHLASCSRCRQALGRATRVADTLALAAPAYQPPPSLKRRLLEQIGQHQSTIGSHAPWLSWRLNTWATLGLALVALALAVWAASLRHDLDQKAAAVAHLQSDMEETNTLLALMTAATAQVRDLVGTGEAPEAWARLYVCPGAQEAVFVSGNLPSLPADKTYQLWLIDAGGVRTNGGVFRVSEGGAARIVVRAPLPLSSYRAFGVTIEPAGGSPGPTGPRVLAGSM